MFTERELQLIENCKVYKNNSPAGLPGHNLMIIVAKQAEMIEQLIKAYDLKLMELSKKDETFNL